MPHKFNAQEKERIRYWIRRGRAVHVGYETLQQSHNFALLTQEEIFSAGASYLFDLIVHSLDEGKAETETDLELMTKIHDELLKTDERLRQVIVSASSEQRKPS